MEDATTHNELAAPTPLPRFHTPAEVAQVLRAQGLVITENFVRRNYAVAGCRPLRGSRKSLRFTDDDIAALVEWMRSRLARGQVDPATLTSARSTGRRKGRAA